uniref:Uncharacterized protein n=1 Tax=Dreissena rostriformis TaxID=205083 RepID=A0A894JP01_9BIVA|nr:hypothetical protein K8L31_mgp22 [Dreissena rostriformis]QRV59720.1 hypothetical protein [Dreissena rostriformis]
MNMLANGFLILSFILMICSWVWWSFMSMYSF